MKYKFQVENIRCGGCANTIAKKLIEINGVEDVDINVEDKQVIVTTKPTIDAEIHQALGERLLKLGYPEVGKKGANSLKVKAASIVSCAIGKASDKS